MAGAQVLSSTSRPLSQARSVSPGSPGLPCARVTVLMEGPMAWPLAALGKGDWLLRKPGTQVAGVSHCPAPARRGRCWDVGLNRGLGSLLVYALRDLCFLTAHSVRPGWLGVFGFGFPSIKYGFSGNEVDKCLSKPRVHLRMSSLFSWGSCRVYEGSRGLRFASSEEVGEAVI